MFKIKVRNVKENELDEVIRVEHEAWPEDMRASREKFQNRIRVFPEGFFGVYVDGKLVGVSTSIIVNYRLGDIFDWNQITGRGFGNTHNIINGNTLYVISLGTSQSEYLKPVREYLKSNGYKSLGTMLLENQQNLAKRLKKEYLILTARVPGFRKYFEENPSIGVEDYLNLTIDRNGKEESYDPEIRFYKRAGLEVTKIIPDAEIDYESMNYGVIMYWKTS